MKPLVKYCRGAVDSLNAQYKMTEVLGHAATAGAARERLILDFLTSHLPEMTSVVSGVIVDSSGRRSRQQDIVLMLKSMPRLAFASGHDLIFQEGTVATFEIKTQITPSVLDCIAENIASVKRLKASTLMGAQLGDLDWPYNRILHVVVTYGGSDLNAIIGKLDTLPETSKPDVYLDLTRGILIKNEGLLSLMIGDTQYLCYEDPAVGLARFLALLSKVTGRMVMRAIEWDAYI
ncbi:MAG: hypothetical protein K0S02_5028 [Achromobacter mucicolens]|jgi:hypothetical protein|uniref:DUF6602 domain-containing protein n=1 Tax=Achromobacter mucicolens TaxID=1389922 RepID=UPI00242B0032|nr:DUF6602 domain-containing protein [Achromobacter mucicolens]MDF2864756.1 hypothetical protein [Achromobacter mucicolens]